MEEDAGKNLHGHGGMSIVDFNRSGVPLVEIVGEPDLRSGEEAADYLRALREILALPRGQRRQPRGGLVPLRRERLDPPAGLARLGTRVELKNINSFRFVQKAIEHEVARQEAVLESGGRVVAETRGWDEEHGKTFSMRSKETAQDYRYFPEPDLAPLVLEDAFVAELRASMPSLPNEKRARYVADYELSGDAARVLTQHPRVAELFERVVERHRDATRAANFVQSEVLRDVVTKGLVAEIPISAEQIAGILDLVASAGISGKQAKQVYLQVRGTDRAPADVVRELGMEQVSDASALEPIVRKIVEASPKQAEQLRGGKASLMGYFVGQVMKETKGSANPQLVNELLKKVLGVP